MKIKQINYHGEIIELTAPIKIKTKRNNDLLIALNHDLTIYVYAQTMKKLKLEINNVLAAMLHEFVFIDDISLLAKNDQLVRSKLIQYIPEYVIELNSLIRTILNETLDELKQVNSNDLLTKDDIKPWLKSLLYDEHT